MTKALMEKLLKVGNKLATELDESEILNRIEFHPTPVPGLNTILSGDPIRGGVTSGIVVWAAPSRHFKTLFCLLCAKTWMTANPDGVLIFYDSEFGALPSYFKSMGIDTSRVIHDPITDYEMLKFDIAKKVDQITPGDKVMIMVDSLGNLASRKEAQDALNENSAADMTRAKESKSFFRVITPHLKIKNIPMHVVQHVYDTMEMYSKKVVSGGQGTMLSAENVFIIGRKQDKDDKELNGYHFVINVEKSRYVKEKSKIDITVSFNGGIRRWSGLEEFAKKGGYIADMSKFKYCMVNQETGELMEETGFKKKNILNEHEIWKRIFKETDFAEYLGNQFRLEHGNLIDDEEYEVEGTIEEAIV